MENHIIKIIIIIIIGGLLGGLTNFYRKNENSSSSKMLIKSIILGISAAFLVPILFKLISSDLIQTSESNNQDYLIIFGFSLAAGIFSTNFIDNVGKTILNLKEDLSKTQEIVEIISSEPEFIGDNYRDFGFKISENELRVLDSFVYSNYIYRAISKISIELEQDNENIRDILKSLQKNKLVKSIEKNKVIKWMITDEGKEYHNYYHNEYGEDSTSMEI